MAIGDAHVFPGFLTPVLTQLFFPKPPTTFLTCFCRGERRKYAGKKSRLNQGSNSQPPDHESDTLTTEPPGRARIVMRLFADNKLNIAQTMGVLTVENSVTAWEGEMFLTLILLTFTIFFFQKCFFL